MIGSIPSVQFDPTHAMPHLGTFIRCGRISIGMGARQGECKPRRAPGSVEVACVRYTPGDTLDDVFARLGLALAEQCVELVCDTTSNGQTLH